jgi:hypothetical protein
VGLLKTRRGLLALLLLAAGLIYLFGRFAFRDNGEQTFHVPREKIYFFKNLEGPKDTAILPQRTVTSWRQYHVDNPSAIAILLTDTSSSWLGLAHGLSGIGLPFTVTTSVTEAIKHKVVLVYPMISGQFMSREEIQAVAAIPRNGGVLIADNVYGGGLNEVFNYDTVVVSRKQKKVLVSTATKMFHLDSIFSDVINGEIILSGGDSANSWGIATVGYTHARTPLMRFDDGTSALVYKDYGVGKAYAFGLDLGSYMLRCMDGRGYDAGRAYVNGYEAGVDIFLRVIKQIYLTWHPQAITINTSPFNKALPLIITHDIDFTRSIVNAAKYAKMEQMRGVKATYFIQTKYIRDWNDDIFFNDSSIKYLREVVANGMEIGSHSVAHSRMFSKFQLGTGFESYPGYLPFVQSRLVTRNGTILGELRISKFLLEHFLGVNIRSFRPGHLQLPFALPQALLATGYINSSSSTAGSVQTFLPYKAMYNSEFDAELKNIEIPIAVEDEAGRPMLQRFDSTVWLGNKLASYGGLMNILIHTDTTGQKYEYEQKVIDHFKDIAWIATMGDFCDWWRVRSAVQVSATEDRGRQLVTVSAPAPGIRGLTLTVPAGWKLNSAPGMHQYGRAIEIDTISGKVMLTFSKQ